MSTPKSSFKRDSFWILKDHARKERKKERKEYKNPGSLCRDVAKI